MRLDRNQPLLLGHRPLVGAEERRLRRTVDVSVDQADLLSHPSERDRQVRGDGRLADSALAAADRDQGARRLRRGHRDPRLVDPAAGKQRRAQLLLDACALASRQPRRIDDQCSGASRQPARPDPVLMRKVAEQVGHVVHDWHIGSASRLATVFRVGAPLYPLPMSTFLGWAGRVRGLFTDDKGPWGPAGSGDEPPPDDGHGGGPWGESSGRRGGLGGRSVTPIDELLRRGRMRFGGGGGGLPGRPNGSLILWAIVALVVVWLVWTSMHSISPGERGVVTRFGRYSY